MGWTVYNSDGKILQSAELSDNAVTTAKILDDAVTYAKLQNLGTADRVLGSASTGVIGEVQIVPDMLATDAVTTVKILDANVTNAKVATGIDAVKLADGSVTNAELQYINTLSSNAQAQLTAKAPLAAPTFTGNAAAVTQAGTDDSTRIATTAHVKDVKIDDFTAGDDNTTLDSSTSRHGLLLKLGGGTTNFLRADGTWNAAASGGKIGQIVQTIKTDTWYSNSTAFDSGSDITGLTVNITPSANSSKILVQFALSGSQSVASNRMQYRLVRTISGGSDTAIYVGDVSSMSRTAATGGISSYHNSILASTSGGIYLDDPGSTTSQITYRLQAKQHDTAGSGTYVYVNRSSTSWDDNAAAVVSASTIVVMEVLA